MEWILAAVAAAAGAVLVFLGSTLVFDVVHVSLHRLAASRVGWLQRLGALHETHHRFLGRDLQVRGDLAGANLRRHVIPEFLTQVSFSAALLLLLPPAVVAPALAAQVLLFLYVFAVGGRDVNHKGVTCLAAHRPHFFCLPEYHAWHHAHPEAHFSSWIKVLDAVLATGASLEGRRIALSGAATPLGAALLAALGERGHAPEQAFPGAPPPELRARLRDVDVLVLAHAEDSRGDTDGWIEAHCAAARGRLLPPEVWGVDRPPAEARRWLRDARVIYRQIASCGAAPSVPAARAALDAVLRGLRFAPCERSLAALYAWLRFRRAVSAPAHST